MRVGIAAAVLAVLMSCAARSAARIPLAPLEQDAYKQAIRFLLTSTHYPKEMVYCMSIKGDDVPADMLSSLGRGLDGQRLRAVPYSRCPDEFKSWIDGELSIQGDEAAVGFKNYDSHWPSAGICVVEMKRVGAKWTLVTKRFDITEGCSLYIEG